MKRDVTISGVRTRRGLLEDALAFARRYYTNNYRDQYKQIALDLFLGNGNDDWEDGLWSANPTATSSVNPVDNEDEMIFAPSSTPFRQINATDSFEGVLDEMFSQALDEFSDNNYNNVSVL